MSREFSLYLDVLRLLAALVVLASHATGYAYGEVAWWPGSLGHNAVVVFFLLSGYVIAFVFFIATMFWKPEGLLSKRRKA